MRSSFSSQTDPSSFSTAEAVVFNFSDSLLFRSSPTVASRGSLIGKTNRASSFSPASLNCKIFKSSLRILKFLPLRRYQQLSVNEEFQCWTDEPHLELCNSDTHPKHRKCLHQLTTRNIKNTEKLNLFHLRFRMHFRNENCPFLPFWSWLAKLLPF